MSYASVTVSIQLSGSPATPVNAVFKTLQNVIPVVPIVTEAADLYMCVTPSPIDQVTTGNPLHYYIDIFDNGPGTASNVTFVADMPANTSFQSLTISAPEYTANVPAVGANGQIRFTVPALPPQYDLKCILSILPTGPVQRHHIVGQRQCRYDGQQFGRQQLYAGSPVHWAKKRSRNNAGRRPCDRRTRNG